MNSMYGFGADESLLARYAWYQNNSNRKTHLAKELRPNFRGLFDMHGNLYEWCHDWYAGYATASMQVDPKGGWGDIRVRRGGCWSVDAELCRAANRAAYGPTGRYTNNGFRLALSPSNQATAEPPMAEASGAEADQ
jgi:formylglycine-generating enzyme required for sulfatase activity